MAREKKENEAESKWGPEQVALARRIALTVLILAATVTLATLGLIQVKKYVDRTVAMQTEPPAVVLANRPNWMSDLVYQQICTAARPTQARSALDSQSLREVVETLQHNPRISPWIKDIHHVKLLYGRKPGDTLEIDCEYRVPVALVHWLSKADTGEATLDRYYLVDAEGVSLPERYPPEDLGKVVYGRNGRMNIRVIEGVSNPPPLPGKAWSGNDVRAGLEMVRALAGYTYTEEIMKVDVTNFTGRVDEREANIVLWTNHTPPTQVRWGLPESDKASDISEIPARAKMLYLETLFRQFGRVDAGKPWVDIRLEKIRYPAETPTDTAAPAAGATPEASRP